ncbi:MAG: alanine racemase [Candidatus Eisenbacteria bacterium]|nr:alanine racemase [Candidatus Latescibacterota bacterium]MBD3303113.1 alanine racemase [Candidatus Eisenbacteria bacterium]
MVRHSSRIELSLGALAANLRFLDILTGSKCEVVLVVKANAYGHGVTEIVPMAEKAGVRRFAAASCHEAQLVSEVCSEKAVIIIMGILYDEDLAWVIENGIEFYVFDIVRLRKAAEVARSIGGIASIHLEVETGGNRTGLDRSDLTEALRILRENPRHLRFAGLCSHLAGAETLAATFRIRKQIEQFEAIRKRVQKGRMRPEKIHLASSAAAITIPEVAYDLVRIGTAAYGIWPSPDVQNLYLTRTTGRNANPLSRVMCWKTDVMHTKKVAKDEFIGYGTSFQAPREMRIAVMPLGYANGYPREMSNRGHVLIRGRKAPVVGSVNMNMFIVDITHIPGVRVGDEVVLIGRQKSNVISLRSFSEFSSALNNEFVSRLPAAIPRQVVR